MTHFDDEVVKGIFEERENYDKHPSFDNEMSLYNLIAKGRIAEIEEFWANMPRPDDKIRGVLSDNPLRNSMYHFVAMITLVTRICINYGLEQEVAYKMSDHMIRLADKKKNSDEVYEVQKEAILSYANLMRNRVKERVNSKQVLQCIDYINQNLHSNITVAELAEVVSLNETYLSKIFKKETGITVSEYIRTKKIEEACWLLKYTNKSSIEIATDLSFSSHSYFISVFKKVMNTTPKEYRNREFRNRDKLS